MWAQPVFLGQAQFPLVPPKTWVCAEFTQSLRVWKEQRVQAPSSQPARSGAEGVGTASSPSCLEQSPNLFSSVGNHHHPDGRPAGLDHGRAWGRGARL